MHRHHQDPHHQQRLRRQQRLLPWLPAGGPAVSGSWAPLPIPSSASPREYSPPLSWPDTVPSRPVGAHWSNQPPSLHPHILQSPTLQFATATHRTPRSSISHHRSYAELLRNSHLATCAPYPYTCSERLGLRPSHGRSHNIFSPSSNYEMEACSHGHLIDRQDRRSYRIEPKANGGERLANSSGRMSHSVAEIRHIPSMEIAHKQAQRSATHRPWEDHVPDSPSAVELGVPSEYRVHDSEIENIRNYSPNARNYGACCESRYPWSPPPSQAQMVPAYPLPPWAISRQPKRFKPILVYQRPEENLENGVEVPDTLRQPVSDFRAQSASPCCCGEAGVCCYSPSCARDTEEIADMQDMSRQKYVEEDIINSQSRRNYEDMARQLCCGVDRNRLDCNSDSCRLCRLCSNSNAAPFRFNLEPPRPQHRIALESRPTGPTLSENPGLLKTSSASLTSDHDLALRRESNCAAFGVGSATDAWLAASHQDVPISLKLPRRKSTVRQTRARNLHQAWKSTIDLCLPRQASSAVKPVVLSRLENHRGRIKTTSLLPSGTLPCRSFSLNPIPQVGTRFPLPQYQPSLLNVQNSGFATQGPSVQRPFIVTPGQHSQRSESVHLMHMNDNSQSSTDSSQYSFPKTPNQDSCPEIQPGSYPATPNSQNSTLLTSYDPSQTPFGQFAMTSQDSCLPAPESCMNSWMESSVSCPEPPTLESATGNSTGSSVLPSVDTTVPSGLDAIDSLNSITDHLPVPSSRPTLLESHPASLRDAPSSVTNTNSMVAAGSLQAVTSKSLENSLLDCPLTSSVAEIQEELLFNQSLIRESCQQPNPESREAGMSSCALPPSSLQVDMNKTGSFVCPANVASSNKDSDTGETRVRKRSKKRAFSCADFNISIVDFEDLLTPRLNPAHLATQSMMDLSQIPDDPQSPRAPTAASKGQSSRQTNRSILGVNKCPRLMSAASVPNLYVPVTSSLTLQPPATTTKTKTLVSKQLCETSTLSSVSSTLASQPLANSDSDRVTLVTPAPVVTSSISSVPAVTQMTSQITPSSPQRPPRASSALAMTSSINTTSNIVPMTTALPLFPGVMSDTQVTSSMEGEEWQEMAWRHGSFLQLLNTPDLSPPERRPTPRSFSLPAARLPSRDLSCDQSAQVFHTPRQTRPTTVLHTSPMEGLADDAAEIRRHKCPYCGFKCANHGQLKGHLRVHTGERPYRCECGRAFARNEELTRHRRIHLGLRPFACRTCAKRFGRKDHLTKHEKTHLGQQEKKVHTCHVPGCTQTYTRSDALARHQWSSHGIRAKSSKIRLLQQRGVSEDVLDPDRDVFQ